MWEFSSIGQPFCRVFIFDAGDRFFFCNGAVHRGSYGEEPAYIGSDGTIESFINGCLTSDPPKTDLRWKKL